MKHLMVLSLALLVGAASAQEKRPDPPPPPRDQGSQAQTQQPPAPVFRTEANFVRVDAYPTKDGRPLHGLTAGDFEVLEDGVPQQIASFEHVVIQPGTPPDVRIEPNSVREGERMAGNPRNRVFVVFLDVPHVQVSSSHAIKEPLIRLLGRMMGPDDLVAVMTPLMPPTDMTFARKTEVIERGLRDNWPWGTRERLFPMDDRETEYDVCYPPDARSGESTESALAREMKARRRERMVLEALHDTVRYLGGIREERKAIVLVTEGWRLYRPNEAVTRLRRDEDVPGADPIGVGPDGRLRRNPASTRTDPNFATKYECDTDRMALASIDNERYFRDLLDDSNRANASFYPIDPRGLAAFDESIGPGQPLSPAASQARLRDKLTTLRELAENTDGLAILDSNNLDAGLKRVSDDLTSYYLLGYYSSNTKLDGGYRALKVRVKTPGVSVRARRGYRAATAAEVSAARAAASSPVPAGAAAIADAVAELARIRPDLPFIVRAVPGSGALKGVWVAGELQSKDAMAAGGTATIDVTAGGRSTSVRAELKPGERAFLVRVPVEGEAAQADVRARFVPAGAAATLPMTYTARVSAPSGLPPALLFRRGSATGNRPLPVAGFQFNRTERARLEIPIGADDKPGAGRLLDKTGQALQVPVTVTERTDADSGQRWLVGDVTLAPLGAGDYAIELSATGAAGERKSVTVIRVGR